MAGRRSGKSERFKRYIVEKAIRHGWYDGKAWKGRYGIFGPTYAWLMDNWWEDVKAMIPRDLIASVSESRMKVVLVTGTSIEFYGVDRAHRIEGGHFDGGIGDEYQQWKENAFRSSIRPTLSDRGREGWFRFLFRPSGKNHAWREWDQARRGRRANAEAYHWTSQGIISESELAEARQTMPAWLYKQEYLADPSDVLNRAHAEFGNHCSIRSDEYAYNPDAPLYIAYDFNVAPGVAGILQRLHVRPQRPEPPRWASPALIGLDEVYIETDASTRLVTETALDRYKDHRGDFIFGGDPAGKARSSSSDDGQGDWKRVREVCMRKIPGRYRIDVAAAAPSIVDRINAVDAMFRNGDDVTSFLIDEEKCPEMWRSASDTTWKVGTDKRVVDKPAGETHTHLMDACGYVIHQLELHKTRPVLGAFATQLARR